MIVASTANGLAIAGLLFTMGGVLLWAKALLVQPASVQPAAVKRAATQRRLDVIAGAAMLLIGLFVQAASHVVQPGFGYGPVVLGLALALGLLLYAALDDLIVDRMEASDTMTTLASGLVAMRAIPPAPKTNGASHATAPVVIVEAEAPRPAAIDIPAEQTGPLH